jgi:hypothetical protein
VLLTRDSAARPGRRMSMKKNAKAKQLKVVVKSSIALNHNTKLLTV